MQIQNRNSGKLSLTNDGTLQIFFIGTGSAFASTLYQTNFLLIKGDKHIMVDFGNKGQMALEDTTGLGLGDIKCLLPTHSHCDHVGGIESILLWNRYVTNGSEFFSTGTLKPESKVKIIATEEYQRILWDYTLRGGLEQNESKGGFARLGLPDYAFILRPEWSINRPREIHEITYGNIHLQLFRTIHIPDDSLSFDTSFVSYGIYLPEERILFSADSKFDPSMFEHFPEAEWIFHDVQFFPGGVHASLDDMKTLPADIKKRTYLTHYGDNYLEQNIDDFAGWVRQGVIYTV